MACRKTENGKGSENRMKGGGGGGRSKLNAAVHWISLARQSHHLQLLAKVLTQQFSSALPVSDQNLHKQNYHHYLLPSRQHK